MEKQPMRYQEIFVAGSQPKYTYNPRESLRLESGLTDAISTPGKVVVVTGPTKSGKTVLVNRILPHDRAIWIDGGAISGSKSPEDDFWQIIVDGLNLAQIRQTQVTSGSSNKYGVKGELGANFVLVKGDAGLSFDYKQSQDKTISTSKQLSSRIAAINGLKKSHITIVIDDFHYLPRALQKDVIRAFKSLVYDGLPVVMITVPHRKEEPIKIEREMTGRTITIEIPTWSEEDLSFIPKTGFLLLNYTISQEHATYLAQQAIGSPHLMQDFCLNACRNIGICKSKESLELPLSDEDFNTVFHDLAKNMGRSMFEKLARGPRPRKDRIQRELLEGKTVDIYQLVLLGLARMKPSLSGIEYIDIRNSIRGIAISLPNIQDVTRVLKYMSKIAASDRSSTPVLDFDEEEQKLYITDPFFAFYLRWGNIAL
jgi:hypothetical protein